MHQFVTLACISNPIGGNLIGTTRWTGVSLQRVLRDIRLSPKATHLKITSADEFYEVVSLEKIRRDPRVMLTYDWDGVPLSIEHGFPLRIYIPRPVRDETTQMDSIDRADRIARKKATG